MQLRVPEPSSLATSGTIVRTEVCLLITQCINVPDPSRIPWHMDMKTVLSKIFLSTEGWCFCLFVCLWGAQNHRASYVNIMLMSVLLLWFFFLSYHIFSFYMLSKLYFSMYLYFSYQHILFRIWFWNMFFSLFLRIYFTIVDLECCVNFWCMARWLSYTYIFFFIFFSIRIF